MRTQEDKNRYLREYRKRTGNSATLKYEKTQRGFLMRLYRNMLSRITGVQKQKYHLYAGLGILPKQSFYKWALADVVFHRLFTQWEDSGYERRLCPSVDRVNSEKGYIIQNMEWVTQSENSRRGSESRFSYA